MVNGIRADIKKDFHESYEKIKPLLPEENLIRRTDPLILKTT